MLYKLTGWMLQRQTRAMLIGSLILMLVAIAHLVFAAIVFIWIAESTELRRSAIGVSLATARDACSELDNAKAMLVSATVFDSLVGATGVVLGLYALIRTYRCQGEIKEGHP